MSGVRDQEQLLNDVRALSRDALSLPHSAPLIRDCIAILKNALTLAEEPPKVAETTPIAPVVEPADRQTSKAAPVNFSILDKRATSLRRDTVILMVLAIENRVAIGNSIVIDVLQSVSKELAMDRASLTTKLSRMKTLGYVEWKSASDLRATGAGLAYLLQLQREVLTKVELEHISAAVEKVIAPYRR